MFRRILESIEGIEWLAIIAMLLFIALFIGIVIWIMRMDKGLIKKMKQLPLDSDNASANDGEITNER